MHRWDKYFLDVCNIIGSNSQCLSVKRGAIIVKDKSIIATGYNGPARGQPRCDKRDFETRVPGVCPRRALGCKSGELMELCPAAHAEINALINAARLGVQTLGAELYLNCEIPCSKCLSPIINAGIIMITCTELKAYDLLGEEIVRESDLIIRTFDNEFYRRKK